MSIALRIVLGALWLAAYGGLHYYVWRKLVRNTELPGRWRSWLTRGLFGLGVGVPAVVFGARYAWPELGRTLGWPAFLWMGLFFVMITTLGLLDLVRLAHRGARTVARRPDRPADPERRAFFNRAIGGGAAVTAVSLTGAGVYGALRPALVEVPITLARLPRSMHGFTITQMSDVHIGNTIGRSFIQDMVDRANAMASDLVVITGDLVDGRVRDLADAAAPLADLRAPHGVYFVTGNHEYYSGADAWIEHLTTLGVRTLRNERVAIGNGTDSFDLAGIDDHSAHRHARGHGADLARAVAGRDPSRELVLLAHQPRQVKQAARHGVGLQLSGHTHGGQIWPWHYIAAVQQGGLLAGLSRHGDTQLYVSRGTGYWGPPVRVLAPAEITRVILHAT